GEGAAAHRHRPDGPFNCAAGVARGLVDEGEGGVEDAAAMTGGGVAGEGAAGHRRRPAILVGQAAAVAVAAIGCRGVARDDAVAPFGFASPPPVVAALSEKMTSRTVSAPKLSIPPPLPAPALPLAIVRPETVTVSPAPTLKTREVLLPLTVNSSAPGPSTFKSS